MKQILLIALTISISACGIFGSDDSKDNGGEETRPTVATTPDLVIELLERAILERDPLLYGQLLHADYQFQFPADEHDLAETADGRWDRLRDVESMTRMLDGEESKDGEVVQDIELIFSEKTLIWDPNVEAEFIDAFRKTYTVQMDVVVSGGTIYQVWGEQEFYVVEVEDRWELIFWRDNGVALSKFGSESRSFGAVKSLY